MWLKLQSELNNASNDSVAQGGVGANTGAPVKCRGEV